MMKPKNVLMDERVFAIVARGGARCSAIAAELLVKDFREVDRSLQRLRKAKKIRYNGTERQWVLA